MNYADGQEVRVGDRVSLGSGPESFGVVVCSIDSGVGSKTHPIQQWGYLKAGVMVESDEMGLVHYGETDPCLLLVARGERSVTPLPSRAYLLRAFLVWLLIIAVETVHGILRTLLLAPALGDFRARQLSVFTASAIVLLIAYLTGDWIGARTPRQRLVVGLAWVLCTVAFELAVGRTLGLSWPRLLEDYDLRRGGLMPLGLLVMTAAPWLAWRLRRR